VAERKPLEGVKVIDAATLFAGPLAATILGDFGAGVLKVEHPKGDPSRSHGYAKDGIGLWWKMLGRNKRAVTLSMSTTEGAEIFKKLVRDADVVIESFRPGTLERWGLSYEELSRENPGLVLARVTGFGQFGPYSNRPGFGTIAESMSGFAHVTGQPGGPPTLPPFGLADGIAALATACAVLMALRARDATGKGQVVDLAIIEPIFTVLGPQPIAYDQLGVIQERTGNRSNNNAPRNTYQTKDGKWVAISTSAQSIAERVMRLVGRPELIDEPWFATGTRRAEHADLLDKITRRQADFDNYRKRVERERAETYNRAAGEVVGQLLPVIDNLRRALDAEAPVAPASRIAPAARGN
jgi:formyl-CoA transferase